MAVVPRFADGGESFQTDLKRRSPFGISSTLKRSLYNLAGTSEHGELLLSFPHFVRRISIVRFAYFSIRKLGPGPMCVSHWIETAGYAQNGCYILLLHSKARINELRSSRQALSCLPYVLSRHSRLERLSFTLGPGCRR